VDRKGISLRISAYARQGRHTRRRAPLVMPALQMETLLSARKEAA
jgi:hypothetical protein